MPVPRILTFTVIVLEEDDGPNGQRHKQGFRSSLANLTNGVSARSCLEGFDVVDITVDSWGLIKV